MFGKDDLDDSLMGVGDFEIEDPERFKEARSGDSMMLSFQCDFCHFLNIHKRLPNPLSHSDQLNLKIIRRAILDSFWSRERSTVRDNFYQARKNKDIKVALNLEHMILPPRGPFPMEDTWGMGEAMCLLWRSLDPGRNTQRVQFDTVRKMRTFQSNYAHAGFGGLGATFIGGDGSSSKISNSPTNSEFYQRFMLGMHKRMGDTNCPDRAVDRYVIKECFEIVELIWQNNPQDEYARKRIAMVMCIAISGYYGGLRGEEINKTDQGLMSETFDEAVFRNEDPFVQLMMLGRFKQLIGERKFIQPLSAITDDGRNLSIWFSRLMTYQMDFEFGCKGPLFPNRYGKKMSIAEMDVLFHGILREVQKRNPAIIGEDVNVEEVYSTYRSLRRGATSEARNADIPPDVINANNRWRSHFRSRGIRPNVNMMEHYSDAKVLAPTLIKFSKMLPS